MQVISTDIFRFKNTEAFAHLLISFLPGIILLVETGSRKSIKNMVFCDFIINVHIINHLVAVEPTHSHHSALKLPPSAD